MAMGLWMDQMSALSVQNHATLASIKLIFVPHAWIVSGLIRDLAMKHAQMEHRVTNSQELAWFVMTKTAISARPPAHLSASVVRLLF
jgi:hypothetical protein